MTSLLSFVDVGKWYWRGSIRIEVLRGVSLDVGPGDFVAVWGRLKAGKTTLLRVAAGLDNPDAGEVRFDGRSLASMSREEVQLLRRHAIGFAQRSGPVEEDLSVLDYVAFPLIGTMRRADAQRRALEALERIGADLGCVELRWDELTDGERTLVSIAHAVVREPKVLLVDDPTSNLGVHERERTIAVLHRLASERGMAVLMTAPDMAATLGAHTVLTLTSGELLSAEASGAEPIRLPGARRA